MNKILRLTLWAGVALAVPAMAQVVPAPDFPLPAGFETYACSAGRSCTFNTSVDSADRVLEFKVTCDSEVSPEPAVTVESAPEVKCSTAIHSGENVLGECTFTGESGDPTWVKIKATCQGRR